MTNETPSPVIFLAFANSSANPLPHLAEEYHRLETILKQAQDKGHCELVLAPYATVDDILRTFQDERYHGRIAIFHYAGHADSYRLLLQGADGQPALADAGGLAAFLGHQSGLQLVFLNGCSTQAQVQALLDAGVAVVIATAQAIYDQVATDFAARFYQFLADGDAIGVAFDKAQAAVETERGGDTRHLYAAGARDTTLAGRWPWDIYPRPGAGEAVKWNLPEAANDLLFGLPPLPPGPLPPSPYRHLDWYRREDAEIFFGRGHAIRRLYQAVTAPFTVPIILFCGQSGVGKSSLLAAGLLPRLEQIHTVTYQRREPETGMLGALYRALNAPTLALPQPLGEGNAPLSTESRGAGGERAAWLAHEAELGKPLTVIIDQVEEVFTRPNPSLGNEVAVFLATARDILVTAAQPPQGKLLLGFRKEWLAEIEKLTSELGVWCVAEFLERLDKRGIVEVITGPARSERLQAQYKLQIADEALPGLIADDLLADQGSAVAPTLQILLTKLWERAPRRQGRPVFDRALYDAVRGEGLGLDDFLRQQLADLGQSQPEAVRSGLALDLLHYHVTDLDTAAQRTRAELEEQYAHQQVRVSSLVQSCVDHRLLVDVEQERSEQKRDQPPPTRLAHDTLGPIVRARFRESDAPGQRARRILENRAVEWVGDGEGAPLDEQDLALVEAGRDGMRTWTEDEERLVAASRDQRAKRQRTRRILWGAGVAALLLIILAAGTAWWQRGEALAAQTDAERQANIALGRFLDIQGQEVFGDDPVLGVWLLIEALHLTPPDERSSLDARIRSRMQYGRVHKVQRDSEEELYFLANNSIFMLDRKNGPGELFNLADSSVVTLRGEIAEVEYFPASVEAYALVHYKDAPSELRYTHDGSQVPLSGELARIQSSPDPAKTYFVVYYVDKSAELRLVANASLIIRLEGEVSDVEFSPDPAATYFAVDYEDRPGELRLTENGLSIARLEDKVSYLEFSPDHAATYLVVDYLDEPGELRHSADGSLIAKFTERISWVQFSSDPVAAFFVVVHGDLGEYSDEDDIGPYFYNDPPAELRRTDNGSIITKLEHESFPAISSVTFSPEHIATYLDVEFVEVRQNEILNDDALFVDVFEADYYSERRYTADGSPVLATESGAEEASSIVFSPKPPATYVVIQPPESPAELHTGDGRVVSLQSRARDVDFSPTGTYFVVHYLDSSLSELRLADGSFVAELELPSQRFKISWLTFSPNETYFVFQSKGVRGVGDGAAYVHELRRTSDGSRVAELELGADVSSMEFSRDASLLVAHHEDGGLTVFRINGVSSGLWLPEAIWVKSSPTQHAPTFMAGYHTHLELYSTQDGSLVSTTRSSGNSPINAVDFSPDASYALVIREDGNSELWAWGDKLRLLSDLGPDLSAHRFDLDNQRLIIWYTDGQTYLVDLEWLRAMGGDSRSHSIETLEKIFCDRPYVTTLIDERSLEKYHIANPPQACQ